MLGRWEGRYPPGRGESTEQGSSPSSAFTCCVTLGKSLALSETVCQIIGHLQSLP